MVEFVVSAKADVEKKCARIDAECLRRIQAEFPLQRQILLISALLFEGAGLVGDSEVKGVYSADYILAGNKDEARRFLQFALAHQAAASVLKHRIQADPSQIGSIDINGPAWWPDRKEFFNAR